MQLLYWLESVRTPFFDAFFSAVTYLGDEAAFICAVLVLFWCIDKRTGYYLAAVGFLGALLNQGLKMTFRVPRPWVLDPDFSIVESARAAATGYSFPSGHTQNAVGIWGALALTRREWWARLLCLIAVVAVPLSRMYLGVHTPLDVGVSVVTAAALIPLLYPLYRRALLLLLIPAVTCGVVCLLYLLLAAFPADALGELAHAQENVCKMTGAAAAMLLGAFVDARYLHFDVRAPWYAQILKAGLGIALVLVLKAVLKPIFALFLPQLPADFLRYFITVVAAAILWPMTFPLFAGKKK